VYGTGRSTLRLGAAASGDRLAEDVRTHRVVHIAAHGIFDDASPMHSYVGLSPSRAGTAGARGDDGYVEAADLIEMDVQADLVVLSSCDTARGRVGDGEGLIGLSWALFVAGTPSVVVSQWKVDATSTTRLMRLFHQRIASGLAQNGGVTGRATSLREASLALLRNPQWSHPFYWAPFVLVGDGG
jgi:CHAT domain-containing protein